MHITLIAVGKLRTPHWAAAQKDYAERVGRYVPLKLVEIKDRIGQGETDAIAKEKEGTDILRAAEDISGLICLDPAGKELSSPEWAKTLQQWTETYSRLAFVVGGPVGISEAVYSRSVGRLSLSRMTFPHEMARVIFLEQLYRALTILKGEKYHK